MANDIASRIVDLIEKYLNDDMNEQEKQELFSWREESEENRELFLKLTDENWLFKAVHEKIDHVPEQSILNKLNRLKVADQNETATVVRMRRYSFRRLMSAAAVILLLACDTYFILIRYNKGESIATTKNDNKPSSDKAPGKDGAILKLANGQEIVLDNLPNGLHIQQGRTEVIKKEGLVSYSPSAKNGEILYNTLITPRGRQFQLMLPDGSHVWLNAESSIAYPTAFAGKERTVQITGEVYLEVVKDASKPFVVSVNATTEVRVLGTAFNIKANKNDEAIKTTLLEGSVKVKKGSRQVVIKPGQQVQVMEDQITIKSDIPVDQVMGWKNGYIYLSNEKLSEVMKDVARWYNIEVSYDRSTRDLEMIGRINRNANLSEFIKLLSASNIDAELDGNKLTLKAQ